MGTKKKPVKSIEHLVGLPAAERRHVLRSLNDDEFSDVMVVCSKMPKISMSVKCEVVDDDDTGVFTAGAIVTVTVALSRRALGEVYDEEDLENSIVPLEELQKETNKDMDSCKTGWKRPQTQKKGGKSKAKPQPQKKKVEKEKKKKKKKKKKS